MAEAKEKRVRAKRRNFEKELAALRVYCEASVEILKSISPREEFSPCTGQIIAFERVLAKINGGAA